MDTTRETNEIKDTQKYVIESAIDFVPDNTDTNLLAERLNSRTPIANDDPTTHIVRMFRNPGSNRLRDIGNSSDRALRQEMLRQLNERFATEQNPTPFESVDLQRQEELDRATAPSAINRGNIFRQNNNGNNLNTNNSYINEQIIQPPSNFINNIEDRLIESVINRNAAITSTIMNSGTLLERLNRNNTQINEQFLNNESRQSISDRLREGIIDNRNNYIQTSDRLSNINNIADNLTSVAENDINIRDRNITGQERDASLLNREINDRLAQARTENTFAGRINNERNQDGNSRSR
jgi:hypothetical protein